MKNFEERLKELEQINERINSDCPLDQAVELFEKGIKLAQSLEKDLCKLERKVEILISPDSSKDSEKTNMAGSEPVLELFPEIDENNN